MGFIKHYGSVNVKVFIIAGPTASGKSQKALELKEQINGNIINADSLQVYPGLPILTAQPTDLTHHYLYGIFQQKCTVALWRSYALRYIETSFQEGRHPIIVGGTGLYLKALIEGLSPIPDIDSSIRNQVHIIPKEEVFSYACSFDSLIENRLAPKDFQRIRRALEVYLQTKKSIFEWQKLPATPLPYEYEYNVINFERHVLYERISQRFFHMIKEGALEEVKNFNDVTSGVIQAIGYRELKDYLHDKITLEIATTLAQCRTRQYAKRQLTWFRHYQPNQRL